MDFFVHFLFCQDSPQVSPPPQEGLRLDCLITVLMAGVLQCLWEPGSACLGPAVGAGSQGVSGGGHTATPVSPVLRWAELW